MEICAYTPSLKAYFRSLNEEWLKKYFVLEPYDTILLENCEEEIIDKGGYIFFGVQDGEVIGTYALLAPKNGCVELGKMAITAAHQGKGYGQQLLKHALKTAKAFGNKEILLYSSRSLKNSIYLYRKFGFKEVPNTNSPYKRGDIKMILKL